MYIEHSFTMLCISLNVAKHTHLNTVLLSHMGGGKNSLLFPNFLFAFNQIHVLIHLFNKYLLSAFLMPGTRLRDTGYREEE